MFPIPKRIGDHHVVRRLSTEGAAEIFLAREDGPMGFSREVVIKLVRADAAGDPLHAAELAREARICARLNHPGIVRMYDFFQEGDRMALVLEYVDGPALDELLAFLAERNEHPSDDEACAIASSVTAALAHSHALTDETGAHTPVLHRALSPKKVLVARDGSVKLGGFGFGKILDRTPDSAVGLVRGSPGYMAPEQARGEHVDARADVYAAGVLCRQLLTAGRSTTSETPPPVAGKLPSLGTVRGDLPRELVAAIDAALEQVPDQRTITCAELSRWIAKMARVDEGKAALRAHVEAFAAAEEYEEVDPESLSLVRPARRRARAMRRGSALGARVLAREASEASESNEANEGRLAAAAKGEVEVEAAAAPAEMPAGRAMTMMGIGPEARDVPIRPQVDVAPAPPIAPLLRVDVAPAPPRRSRSLVVVIIGAFSLVTFAVLVVALTRSPPSPRAPSSSSPSSPSTSSVSTSTSTTPAATSTMTTTPSAVPSAPSTITVPSTALPKGWGWLVVHSPSNGKVFVNGKQAGDLDTPIALGCGPHTIAVARLGKLGHPASMTKPQWFNVKCGNVISETTIQ